MSAESVRARRTAFVAVGLLCAVALLVVAAPFRVAAGPALPGRPPTEFWIRAGDTAGRMFERPGGTEFERWACRSRLSRPTTYLFVERRRCGKRAGSPSGVGGGASPARDVWSAHEVRAADSDAPDGWVRMRVEDDRPLGAASR